MSIGLKGVGKVDDIIDFHQHLILPTDKHLEVMKRNNISASVVMPFLPDGVSWKNALRECGINEKSEWYRKEVLLKLLEEDRELFHKTKESDDLICAPWMTPYDEESLVRWENSERIKIVKYIPIFDVVPNIGYYSRVSAMVSRLEADIVMIHTGWESPVLPLGAFLIGNNPDKTFVLAHMKEDTDAYNEERMTVMNNYENVYLETSYCPHPKRIMQYVKAGFGKRLLFGTDFRTMDDEQTIRYYTHLISECDISESQKRDILFNNASRILSK